MQGLNKAETAAKHGEAQVKIWRRSYDIPPPPLAPDDPRHPGTIRDTRRCRPGDLPLTESLKDTVARFLPYWDDTIAPAIRSGKRVLIAAHGNSLRALVKYLDGISDQDIVELNIPTGIPLVYELDDDLKPRGSRYLGDQEAARKAAEAVAQQARAAGFSDSRRRPRRRPKPTTDGRRAARRCRIEIGVFPVSPRRIRPAGRSPRPWLVGGDPERAQEAAIVRGHLEPPCAAPSARDVGE